MLSITKTFNGAYFAKREFCQCHLRSYSVGISRQEIMCCIKFRDTVPIVMGAVACTFSLSKSDRIDRVLRSNSGPFSQPVM